MRRYEYNGALRTVSEIAQLEGVSPTAINARISRNGSPTKIKTWDGPSPCSRCGGRGHYAPTCAADVAFVDGAGI